MYFEVLKGIISSFASPLIEYWKHIGVALIIGFFGYGAYSIKSYQNSLKENIKELKQEKYLLQINLENTQELLKKEKGLNKVCLYEKELLKKKSSFIIKTQKKTYKPGTLKSTKITKKDNNQTIQMNQTISDILGVPDSPGKYHITIE